MSDCRKPRIEWTCCDESQIGLYIFLVWWGLDSTLFSVTCFYFLLSGCINLTSLVISYEFLSFIQLAYRWLITYCALVLLILSRMMHQVPYDTLVLICDWWLGTFNYLEKKIHRSGLYPVWFIQLKWFDAKWGKKKSTLMLWKNAICGKPPSNFLLLIVMIWNCH